MLVIDRQIHRRIEWLDDESAMEIEIETWCCRNNLVYEELKMIDRYNENVDDDDAYLTSFYNVDVAWS